MFLYSVELEVVMLRCRTYFFPNSIERFIAQLNTFSGSFWSWLLFTWSGSILISIYVPGFFSLSLLIHRAIKWSVLYARVNSSRDRTVALPAEERT
jgi:hypothetical protein